MHRSRGKTKGKGGGWLVTRAQLAHMNRSAAKVSPGAMASRVFLVRRRRVAYVRRRDTADSQQQQQATRHASMCRQLPLLVLALSN
jgi:hypothetical protein